MKNYVCSYVNPDLDGTACGIALAKLLNYTPVYFGDLDCESQHVLKHLDIAAPENVSSLMDADNIALVDTHHVLQLAKDLPLDKVTLIIDHHPKGDDDKFPNAKIDNRVVGAAASIIAERYLEQGIDDEKMLRLLGFAMASNTVNFSTANATDFDREIFARINERYPISQQEIKDMLYSRANILKQGLRKVVESDIKIFDTKHGKIGIAQIGFPGLSKVIDTEAFKPVLVDVAKDMGLNYFLMNGGDAEDNTGIVISANAETTELLKQHFNKPFEHNVQKFDKMLLRKIDFLF